MKWTLFSPLAGFQGTMLQPEFFNRDTLLVARELLGVRLVSDRGGQRVAGRIVETEAYTQDDPAYHGWGIVDGSTGSIRPTGRGFDLFGPPGRSYVYLCYGVHWMLNVLTEHEGVAGCVLIRALEPVEGLESMWQRRGRARRDADLTNGPGKLTQALGIDGGCHRQMLTRHPLFFEPRSGSLPQVAISARIGISRAIERPWRFYEAESPFVSPGVPSDVAAERRRGQKRRRRRPA